MVSILMIIPPEQFSEKEFFTIRTELEKAGFKTVIASLASGLCSGSQHRMVMADYALAEVSLLGIEGVVFIGGRGSASLFTNVDALRISAEMAQLNKMVAAICMAPVILANAGILEHRRATVAKKEVATLESRNAIYTGPGVEVDGNILTASGPGYSMKLAKEIITRLELNEYYPQ